MFFPRISWRRQFSRSLQSTYLARPIPVNYSQFLENKTSASSTQLKRIVCEAKRCFPIAWSWGPLVGRSAVIRWFSCFTLHTEFYCWKTGIGPVAPGYGSGQLDSPIMAVRCSFYRLLRVVLPRGSFKWKAKNNNLVSRGCIVGRLKQSSARSRSLEACVRCDGVVFLLISPHCIIARRGRVWRFWIFWICWRFVGFDLYFDDLFQVVQSGDSHPERIQQHGTNGTDVKSDPAHLHVGTHDHSGRRRWRRRSFVCCNENRKKRRNSPVLV